MPLPAGVDGVSVSSGKPLTLPDGTPIAGKLLFTAPDVVTVAGLDVALGGTTEARLVGGEFSVTLAANDVSGMSPTGWTYRVTAVFSNAPGWVRYIALPKTSSSVSLAQVIVPDPAEGNYVPVVGPKGDPGDPGPQGIQGVQGPAGPQPPLGAAGAGPTIALKSDDPTTTNQRVPTAHAASHGFGGSDELALDQAQITGLLTALAALLPKAGGTLTGDLVVDGHNLTVKRADGTGAYRLRVTGGGLDFEIGGLDVTVSAWSGADFTGTQANVLRLEPAGPHLIGRTQFGTTPYDDVHDIDATTGVASLGAKNGLVNIRFCGRRVTTGAPTSGTWAAGDTVQDSVGALWLCTAGGSPGTWVGTLSTAGGTITGTAQINAVPGTVAALPAGYNSSASPTGLTLGSTYPSDDVVGGTDGTGRLNLYSYQRSNANSFGETIRNFLMRKDSKAMTAWYGPSGLYDGNRDPVGTTWKPWAWTGAHYESNGHTGIHGHWEVEVPDSTGALQGRFEILFADQTTGVIGLDVTKILTNQAHFIVRTSNGQQFRLAAAAGTEKPIVFANDTDGVATRWKIRSNSTAEAGSNAGSDFNILRYDDTGTLVDQPFAITRSSGLVTIGGTAGTSAGLLVTRNGGVALTVTPLATGGQAILVTGTDNTAAAYQTNVSGDTVNRFKVFTDGKHEWGDGTNSRDANLYRSSAGLLKTDGSLTVVQNLRINTTSTASGSGVLAMANASTLPTGTPSGGGVLYVDAGALKFKGSSGTVTTIAVA